MGLELRGKWLLLAGIATAGVAACGGTLEPQIDLPGDGVGAPGAGAGGSPYSGYPAGNGSYIAGAAGLGGANPYPNAMGGTAGYGAGGGGGHPTCPTLPPPNGSACSDPAAPFYECVYEAGCNTQYAFCRSGRWSLATVAVLCNEGGAAGEGPINPPGPLSCPSAIPETGKPCYLPQTLASYRCDYTNQCSPVQATCTGTWNVIDFDLGCAAGAGGA